MLYGNQSISHYTRSNIALWMSLAFQAGLINIGGFMACHRFVAHVTGFAAFFGYELTQPGETHAVKMLVVPLFFLFGAMCSGVLVDLRLKLHKNPKYYLSFGLIFLFILTVFVGGILGQFGPFGESVAASRDYLLLALLCLSCGIQNGTITTVSKSVIRTTHLTGLTTDLGLGIVRILNRDRLPGHASEEGPANLMRIGIILCFGLGSVLGAFAFSRFGYWGFSIPALTSGSLFGTMLYFQVYKRRQRLSNSNIAA